MGAGGKRTRSSAATAIPEARTAGARSLLAETGLTRAGSEPTGGRGDAAHPQPGPRSRAARGCSRSSPAGAAWLSAQLVFAPVGYIKHSVFSLAPGGLRRLRVPQANHLHAKMSKLSAAFPKTQGWRGWEEAVIIPWELMRKSQRSIFTGKYASHSPLRIHYATFITLGYFKLSHP